ncbi:YjbH domain-containing protein [Roseisalinus antarcticus]|uniref:Exopolysaccharide biosynthesis protein YbjH n=1 Tax=Roseisalinus antarcticus TaxID=254357 RepID=A0A1Y5TKK7_9RHOB|nr:YjbH domain-containing protein [Roseisalinus antarcticus]SLN66117.1 hypothetical protein ROA7023_03131 [Roseisalinus antarcticus]
MRKYASASFLALCLSPCMAGAQTLSFYGTPGLVDMPTAASHADGNLSLTSSYAASTSRNTLSFQITPRLTGVFRYGRIEGFDDGNDRFDRSFDVHYRLIDQSRYFPAVAVGLRDFGGTGIYSSEYLVATKSFGERFALTGGIGWGRLAGRDPFDAPLGFLSDEFKTRPVAGAGGFSTTGQLDFDNWFRGDAAVFGGVSYRPNDRWTVVAEYSTDLYRLESEAGLVEVTSPYNFGVSYQFRSGLEVGAYSLYGTDAGVRLSYVIDPATPRRPGGIERAPAAYLPRDVVAAASWNRAPDGASLRQVIEQGLSDEGMPLEGFTTSAGVATVRLRNERWPSPAQAAGRAARVLANALPGSVERFRIVFVGNGLPLSVIELNRSDLYELQYAVDGDWRMLTRTRFSDGSNEDRGGERPGAYPKFDYNIGPYASLSYFDPDSPIRAELGVQLTASYTPQPGVILSGRVRQALTGNLDDQTRESDSVLPRVRSDSGIYNQQSELEISYLTGEYFFRPRPEMFGRVTAGYLEQMFGGVSSELLWYPTDSRLALGIEVNYVQQREFDGLFEFQDYDVWTGHGSAYYDFGNGFLGQLDVGRYLAGDWGTTVTVNREFNNGFKVGAFFTLTDVSFEDFGEGSFDKGIRIEIPATWLLGAPSQRTVSETFRPVLRDGGARLNVRNRLYDMTRDYRGAELSDEWGQFFR